MEDFKIIEDKPTEAQKKLNQWKHKYWIVIHGFRTEITSTGAIKVIILLTRNEKE